MLMHSVYCMYTVCILCHFLMSSSDLCPRLQLSRKLAQAGSGHAALQRRAADAEARLETATSQLSAQVARERELVAERRELHRQIDRLRLRIARNAGYIMYIDWHYNF